MIMKDCTVKIDMNSQPTILYFGNDWSAENRTSSHHIARRLIKHYRVIYVECPGLRAPKGNARDIKKIFSKLSKCLGRPRPIDERSYVYTLFQIPFHRFALIRKLNRWLIVRSLRSLCRKLKIQQPILWFVLPHLAMVLGRLDESFAVYYCTDDYSSMPGVNRDMIQEMDHQMTEKCDVVFCSAQPLVDSKKMFADKVHLSRHGVDFDHFHQVQSASLVIAKDVASLKHPVIGFFGLMENWVDLGMVRYAAQKRPDWTFLMIGRLAVEHNPCQGLANVHFIGSRPYEVLPSYAKVFDAAVIPCVTNELIYNFNPLKLREYLAMGKPIVSTAYPEVEVFKDIVEIAHSKEEFVEKIEHALKTDNPEKMRMRIDSVRDWSWDHRFEDVISTVNKYFEKKQGSQ